MNKIPSMFSKKPVVIFSALTLLALFGVFQLPKAQAGYYGITPTSATVAVGSSVQFHLYDSSGGSDQEVTLTDGDKMTADPFYVKKGDLSGSLVGVNPGVVTVYYNAGSTFGTVKATLTVTGSPAVTTGKIKITTSKAIYYQMFPIMPGCDAEGNYTTKGCRWGTLGSSYTGGDFRVDDSFNPPVLMTDQVFPTASAPAKGNETGPWAFTLQDPMNPALAPFASPTNEVDTWYDARGDFGWALLTDSVAFSKDGSYQFITNSQREIDGWHNGVKKNGFGNNGSVVGVIDRGYKTFLITDLQTLDVTDFDKIPTVHKPYRFQYNNDGTPIPCTAGCSGYNVPGPLPKLPSSFPIMPNGRKFILSNDNYVADFIQPNIALGRTLNIYDLGQPNPVATLALSSDIFNGSAGQPSQNAYYYFQQKIDADTDYLVMIVKPGILRTCTLPTFNTPSVCTPKDPIPYSEATYGSMKVFVYKFTFSTKTLTKIVNGTLLDPGMVTGVTGFNVGGQRGVMVFTTMGLDYSATGLPTRYEGRARAYLYTDLATGTTADVLANSPVNSSVGGYGPITSLVSGDSTYVYLVARDRTAYVWKLDLAGTTPPSVAICQDSTSLNYGGTLPCRYPPRPRPACSPGDPFSTDTGLPCSGTTGTGRKLSCVNLSSSIYCSYTPDTLVTAVPPRTPPPTPPPSPAVASCSLSSAPISFEPRPPGAIRPVTLSSGFNSSLALYQNGGSGPYRLLMSESFGYSVLDLSNPVNPTALIYHDVRLPVGGLNSVTNHGDGQSDINSIAVSPDGQRAAFGTGGPAAPFQTVVGSPSGSGGFTLWGDFYPERPLSTLVQHVGARYIAYNFFQSNMTATDVTTLPTDALVNDNMAGYSENTTLPPGYSAVLAGNYLLYLSGTNDIIVVDASNPGPVGSIAMSYPRTTITSSDFGVGGRTIAYFHAAVDPADATKVWVLAELNRLAGENSPSYGLLYVTSNLTKVSAGPIWRVPSVAGESWTANAGLSSALIASNGSLFALMFAQRNTPNLIQLYSTTVAAWGAVNSSAPPGKFDIPTAFYSNFSPGQPMRGFAGAGNSIYAYIPTGRSAYVIPMSCGTSTTSYTPPPSPPPPPPTPTPPPSPPPAPYSCPTGASLGLPACNNGCYVAQPGLSGRPTADIWKCVPNGSFTQLLKLGSSGSQVVALQNFLNTAGYDCGTADGKFGPKTQAAVIKFQIANGLVGDGIVGAQTRSVLNK